MCEKDKFRCACGSLVGQNPSPLFSKLIEDLPWMCQNYKRNCREIKTTINELELHQRKCIFRKVYCPNLGCARNIDLVFKNVMNHLNDYHDKEHDVIDGRKIQMLKGKKDVWKATLINAPRHFELHNEGKPHSLWSPGKMTSTSGDVFFFEAKMSNDSIYFWVNYFGSSDDAKNFTVNFSVDNTNFFESFIYNGPVHTLDEDPFEIVARQNCFSIKREVVLRCLRNKRLTIKITIENRVIY